MSRQPHEAMLDVLNMAQDAMRLNASPPLVVRPSRPAPLAQVEVLMTFHPALQSGGPRNVTVPTGSQHAWLSVDVFGRHARSASGRPLIEDMRLEANGEDVSGLLEDLANQISDYVAGE